MVTVLLVEDDDLVRRATTKLLIRLRYKVIGFCDGSLAREFLKTSNENIDLIVSDIRMPEMDGIEFYRWLAEHMPHMLSSFLFHSSSESILTTVDLKNVPRIDKPADSKSFTTFITNHLKSKKTDAGSQLP